MPGTTRENSAGDSFEIASRRDLMCCGTLGEGVCFLAALLSVGVEAEDFSVEDRLSGRTG